jgi:predicted nucleic acid-binding Zn ribbon protein
MAKMLFDFSCDNHHITEHFVTSNTKEVTCPECALTAKRIISPVPTIFKGHGWPDKDLKWAKDHEKGALT